MNEEFMIRSSFEEVYDLIISPSDDGNIYIWNKMTQNLKNGSFEFVKCFENPKEIPTCSFFANDLLLSLYIKKLIKVTQHFFVKSIIVNTSTLGKIQVLINTEI